MPNEFFLLQRADGKYLTDDFGTWSSEVESAHRFIRGAALNACVEMWRRDGAHVVAAPSETGAP